MLARSATRYEKALDYSSKKYGNGLEEISMQDSSSLALHRIPALSFGAEELRLPPAHCLLMRVGAMRKGKPLVKLRVLGSKNARGGRRNRVTT
jgi:hypothetical protein